MAFDEGVSGSWSIMSKMASVLIASVRSSSLRGRRDLGFSDSIGENQSGSVVELSDEAGLTGVDALDVADGVEGVFGLVVI